MKIIHGLLPLVALIIAASWLTNLRGSTVTVKQENAAMRERLASPRKSSFSRENRIDTKSKSVRQSVRAKRERKTPENLRFKSEVQQSDN
jgi:FtsZ-interacting cell division protein ZipA